MSSKMLETAYIDISEAKSTAEMVHSLGQNLESEEFQSKKIVLNLGETELSQNQLMGLKVLVEGVDSIIDFVHSSSSKTKLSALTAGISIANQKDGEYMKEDYDAEVISARQDELLDDLMPTGMDLPKELQSEVSKDAIKEMQYVEIEPRFDEQIYKEEEEVQEMETTIETPSVVKEFILDERDKNINGDTVYITQTLRSGQVASYDGNIVIIGDCHSGSEVVASGDITVWGVLGGVAHAGATGDEEAKIRALKIDAIQLRIANYFARRPDRANIEFTEKTDTFTPEEARVDDGGIYIYTMSHGRNL